MIHFEIVYQSVLAFASGIAPSGVTTVEGQSYGVRYLPPTGKNPSIAVSVEDVTESHVELGSISTDYFVTFHITAQSRKQRDALKYIVYSGCLTRPIPLYSSFSSTGSPASGAAIIGYAEIQGSVILRDTLDFESDRERLFWSAGAFCGLTVLG